MKFILPLLPLLCILLSACSKNHYDAGEVTIEAEGYTDRGIELKFKTPSESQYYCPGLKLDYQGNKVRYSYVRSHINKVSPIDVTADYRDGDSVVVIPFPAGQERVELIDPSGKSLGTWKINTED